MMLLQQLRRSSKMRKYAAFALTVACALHAFAAEGFRWKIDEVNEITRPGIENSANLSAIAWMSNDTYIAISDWNSVIWELTLPHNPETGRIRSCDMKRVCSPERTVDIEGLALDPLDKSVWLADERAATISQFSLKTGKALSGNVNIPRSLKEFRLDSGFESLSITKDGLSMWTCTEDSLKTDGSRATKKDGADIRLTRFQRKSANNAWQMNGQWVYHTDSIAGGPWYSKKKRDLSRSGISELCVLDDGTVLVLEREFSVVLVPRLRCRIYETDISSAKNVIGEKNLGNLKNSDRVKKKLLYETTGFSMYEGLCVGPRLADGSRMLVLVSDADKKSFRMVLSLRLSKLKKQ
jgi:hypothetical protein